jgi:hypothetical protein
MCEFETQDLELKLYHNILTELIEQHFHNGYLRQVAGELADKYPNPTLDFADTAEFCRDVILLQNKLFNDTSKFETIYYCPSLSMGPWKYIYSDTTDFYTLIKADTTKYMRELKTVLTSFSSNWESVADTLAKPQTKYTSESFKLCTSKVAACEHYSESNIGVISFSRVFMNSDQTKGLLYYEFMCGGKCGKGEIILVQYINERWTIKNVIQLWIS